MCFETFAPACSRCFSVIVLLHYLSYCVWLRRCEALVEEDQSKTEVTSNRGQLPHAPCWRGAWTSCSIWKGWWQGGPTASPGPAPEGGKARTGYMHTHACARTKESHRHEDTQSLKQGWKKKKTRTDKITHAHGRNSNNAIRDSLMILEGRVCGLPLIFPLSLLIPQSLLQRKKPNRAEREQGRQRERARMEELPTSIKKQQKEGWERVEPSGKKRKIKLVLLAWLYLQRRQWTVDSPLLSQLPLKPWLNNRAGFGRRCRHSPTDFLSETNTARLSGLSVQPLVASINPAPPPNLPAPITDWER